MFSRFLKYNLFGLLMAGLAFALILPRVDWSRLVAISGSLDFPLVAAAFLLMMLQIVFLSARWDILINLDRPRIPVADLYRMSFVSMMTNFLLLTSLSGMALRLALAIQAGTPWVKSICASVIDRFFSLGTLLFIALLFLPFTLMKVAKIHLSADVPVVFILTLVALIGLVLFAVQHPTWLKRFMDHRRFRQMRYYFIRLVRAHNLGKAVLYSLAAQFSFFLAVYFILSASGAHISFFHMMIVLPLISVVSSLPISISGWGVREGLFIVGFGMMNNPMEIAFITSIQVGIYTMLAALVLGLPCLLDRRFQQDLSGVFQSGSTALRRLRSMR